MKRRFAPYAAGTGHAYEKRKSRNGAHKKIGSAILVFLYACALLADFLSPYTMTWSDKTKSFHPPSGIVLFYTDADGDTRFRPYCHEMVTTNPATKEYAIAPQYTLRAICTGRFPGIGDARAISTSKDPQERKREVVSGLVTRFGFDLCAEEASIVSAAIDDLELSPEPDSEKSVSLRQAGTAGEEGRIEIRLVKGNRNFLEFLYTGVEYDLFGLVRSSVHFFGSATGGYYPFGGDQLGRDVLSRVLHGGRVTLTIGLLGVFLSFSIALAAGGLAGYRGGRFDYAVMRLCDAILAFPALLLIIAVRAALPRDIGAVGAYLLIVIVMAILDSAYLSRVVRGVVLSRKNEEHVLAAKAMGVRDRSIIVRHVFLNSAGFMIAKAATSIPGYMLAESALSFLGLGITEPYASWGLMLSSGGTLASITRFPWLLAPGIFIMAAVIAWNLVGDRISGHIDPIKRKW